MKAAFVFLALLLVGCHESINPINPPNPVETVFVEPPEGVSFISAEYDGKEFDYVEGKNRVKSLGTAFSSFSNNTELVGFGETLGDSLSGTHWTILFYFTQQEWKQNLQNSTKLLDVGVYNFLLQDKNYNPVGSRGTAVETVTMIDSTTGRSNSTLIQQDNRLRSFTVKRVYFNNLTNNQLLYPLIWVEGSFEGWMAGDKKIKGQFRIKTRYNL